MKIIIFGVSIILLLVTIMANGLISRQISRQEDTFDTKSNNLRKEVSKLGVSIELSKYKFRLDDKGKLIIKIKNDGESPFYIYKNMGWGQSSSLTYYIENEDGESIINLTLLDAIDTPPFKEEDFVKLESQQSFTKERWLDMYTEGITKPGKYKLVVSYHSPITQQFAPSNLEVWTTEDGIVESKAITFNVTK